MNGEDLGGRRGLRSIRGRLLAALALALAPVLALGGVEAGIIYAFDLQHRRENLIGAAQRSAATVRAQVESGAIVLETLTSRTVGLQCSQGLNDITTRLRGYSALIRFDRLGRVSCASGATPLETDRRAESWFQQLAGGDRFVIAPAPAGYADGPALLAVVRSEVDGAFDGGMAAVIPLSALQEAAGSALPPGSEVALADSAGRMMGPARAERFPARLPPWAGSLGPDGAVFDARDTSGDERYFAVAPLAGGEAFVVISAPPSALEGWSRITMASTLVPPILAFVLALAAVWVATDRVVIRWLRYLQRVASIYARGRFTVRAVHAAQAPPEIAELANTLDAMANVILERDESLLASLKEKDQLLREIHHRVKNNLQVISSLVSMQQRALEDQVAREALQDTRQRISALSLVYRALYQGPDLRRVDLNPFLEELTAQLVMSESVRGHAVRTQISADHLAIDPDRLAPLALFAVEAITNAQKHAFAGRGGALTVTFKVGDDEARLEIADSGSGAGEPSLGEGVGRTLMTAFARQLGGRAEFKVNDAGGLSAILSFPIPAMSAA